jgi:serine/threonine protein kinase
MTGETATSRRRWARALASPAGVLVTVPLLVVGAGLAVLLFGRDATRSVSDTMARRQLAEQAGHVGREVGFALDQAAPMLDRLRAIAEPAAADPAAAFAAVGPRLYDIAIGRPGVANVSISYPRGVMQGTFFDPAGPPGTVRVQQSVVGAAPDGRTARANFDVDGGALRPAGDAVNDYDPRKRLHYEVAVAARGRAWTPPRVFFSSRTTGITCTEPVYDAGGALVAVVTVDFDIGAMSSYVARSPLPGARTVVYAGDGTILAYSAADRSIARPTGDQLLRAPDLADPAVDRLFAALAGLGPVGDQRFAVVGDYLASIAPVAGQRAGVAQPLDWYVATLVPESTLLAPTRRLERRSVVVSVAALAVAVALAVLFAYYLNRMRRQVAASRELARSAEARARELGSYRLVARIGAGGMGEVWRAEHRLLARQAAIKLIRHDSDDPDVAAADRERFRREAQTLAAMRSRHTIELYDYGVTEDGTFFYVMELLDGLDFNTLVAEHGAQPPARVIALVAQACASLAEAHDAGLMHRDLKPANLFACRAADEVDVVKLLDFGIVHAAGESPVASPAVAAALAHGERAAAGGPTPRLTQAGAVIGTPGYMPPEQAMGLAIDPRSDLYALGCVAWALLTATEVFPAHTDAGVTFAHLYEDVPDLRERMRGAWIPDELIAVIRACLAKRPEDRPPTARDLAARLRAIPIPPEHAWTDARARDWWTTHHPFVTGPMGAAPVSGEARVLVPKRSDAGAVADTIVSSANRETQRAR